MTLTFLSQTLVFSIFFGLRPLFSNKQHLFRLTQKLNRHHIQENILNNKQLHLYYNQLFKLTAFFFKN